MGMTILDAPRSLHWRINCFCNRKCPFCYGPEKPICTPPGARTIAIVTPSITRVGGITLSAPSRSAFAKASCASAT